MSGFLHDDEIAHLLEDEDQESGSESVNTAPIAACESCEQENISDCEEAEVVSCSEDSVIDGDDDSLGSSSEGGEDEEEETRQTSGFYRGKNRFKWSKNPPSSSRVRQHNIITHLPGLAGQARDKINMSEFESWKLLFPDDLIEIVCLHTNQKITEFTEKYTSQGAHTEHVSLPEMKAFLGLMLLTGVFKSGHEDVHSLRATDGTGRDVFRVTISLKDFCFF